MKSIKRDLEDRLEKLIKTKEDVIANFENREKVLRQMIIEEERLFPNADQLAFTPSSNGHGSLIDAVYEKLIRENDDVNLSVLVGYVADLNLLPKNKSPGRVVHGALINLKRQGKVTMPAPRTWRAASKNT